MRASRAPLLLIGLVLAGIQAGGLAAESISFRSIPEISPGLGYTNFRIPAVPWSIHVARVRRSDDFEFHSVHARGRAIGVGRLTEMVGAVQRDIGSPVIGINGDFYQRENAYAGDPRGLQIVEGDLISRPIGGAAFWIDSSGKPQLGKVAPAFEVRWSESRKSAFGLNEERPSNGTVLYTPDVGPSTRTAGGRELVLERAGDGPWLPLAPGLAYRARIAQIREGGNARFQPGSSNLILSVGSGAGNVLNGIDTGKEIVLSTATTPDLRQVRMAISGGPILLRNAEKLTSPRAGGGAGDAFEFRSMAQRHPRTAIGWNGQFYFLVEVDGRQHGLSIGMTLDELADLMEQLGCSDAMNLDGGGSSTFWFNGAIRNSPCEQRERDIANALVVVRRPENKNRQSSTTGAPSTLNQ